MSTEGTQKVISQLHTVLDYVRFAASEFNRAELYFGHGTDNSWNEAIVLVMFALHLEKDLFEQTKIAVITDEEKLEILSLVERRIAEQIPAAYLTNQAMFAGLPFYVDERVLVPRSPIAELISNKFSQWFREENQPTRILDLCTGSGCIAIACAYAFPNAEVDAVDLSEDALNVAQINIEHHGLLEQVIPIQSDVFSSLEGFSYDLIVTNPPYVDAEDVGSMPTEYQHEPEMGLGCGDDGLDIVRKILVQAPEHLTENGWLICEVGNSQVHVEALYPNVPFNWLNFEYGGHGVFAISRAQLVAHQEFIKQQVK